MAVKKYSSKFHVRCLMMQLFLWILSIRLHFVGNFIRVLCKWVTIKLCIVMIFHYQQFQLLAFSV